MKHFICIVIGIVMLWGAVTLINEAQSGFVVELKLSHFKHPVIKAHWTNPADRVITVLMDDWAVSGTDIACNDTLDMLDKITEMAPGWMVRLISPTGWVPTRVNPLDRQVVVAMIEDKPYWDSGRPGLDVNE